MQMFAQEAILRKKPNKKSLVAEKGDKKASFCFHLAELEKSQPQLRRRRGEKKF